MGIRIPAHPDESRDPSRLIATPRSQEAQLGSRLSPGRAERVRTCDASDPATSDNTNLLRLLTWLSPAFPVGAFGYSHGLEQAIHDGAVTDAAQLSAWIAALVGHGSGWTDAVLLKAAWVAGDDAALAEVAELADALAVSAERRRETLAQGEAFIIAAKPWLDLAPAMAYPVAVGAVAGRLGVPITATLTGWLHAFAANLVSVAVRAVPLGQTAGVAVIAGLEPVILATAARATTSTLDDLGSAALISDIAAMRHETLQPRLFIS